MKEDRKSHPYLKVQTPFKIPTISRLASINSQNNQELINPKNGSTRVEWTHRPTSVLIVEKKGDSEARCYLIEAAQWMNKYRQIKVFVESYVAQDQTELIFLREFCGEHIDFVVSFGGDSTLIHISSLFPEECPPICLFSLTSLGFLTPFISDNYQATIDDILHGPFYVCSRAQILINILRKNGKNDNYQALNEIIFRSQSVGSVCSVDCFIDDEYFTTIFGNGLVVATSTGSTAYALSAGGAMVHPSILTLIWTPICPHSLNAHPIILPFSIKLSFTIPEASRSNSYILAYDGHPTLIEKGDMISVTTSPVCVPTICSDNPITDWLNSLSTILKWNQPISYE